MNQSTDIRTHDIANNLLQLNTKKTKVFIPVSDPVAPNVALDVVLWIVLSSYKSSSWCYFQ